MLLPLFKSNNSPLFSFILSIIWPGGGTRLYNLYGYVLPEMVVILELLTGYPFHKRGDRAENAEATFFRKFFTMTFPFCIKTERVTFVLT